jgi:hypothetical protein
MSNESRDDLSIAHSQIAAARAESPRNKFFEQIDFEISHFRRAPEVFFSAWKRAAALAGAGYFGCGKQSALESATTKWDLQPNLERISRAIGAMSCGERVFLAALVSFYNSQDGGRLLHRAGVQGLADLGGLDLDRRTLVATLILNYTGW